MKVIAISLAVLAVVLCSGVCAEKLSVDPYKNGGSTQNLDAKESISDARLAKKVTYTSTDKRLHFVLSELTKQTGVKIESGRNLDDWPVRDIPLIVCVKDIPLGKLLRAIADATHLALSSSTVKGVKCYRIWRDNARQNLLSNYFKSVEDTKKARLTTSWDSWIKLSKQGLPADFKGTGKPDETSMLKSTAEVMAALPAGSKEAMLSGKMLSFGIKNASPQLASALTSYYRNLEVYAQAKYEYLNSLTLPEGLHRPAPAKPYPLTDSRLVNLQFKVGSRGSYYESIGSLPSDDEDEHSSSLFAGLHYFSKTRFQDLFSSPVDGGEALTIMGEEAPELPRKEPATDFSTRMRKLDGDAAGLQKTFKIAKPKSTSERTFADVVADVAEASAFSIVCEDFRSHRESIQYDTNEQFTYYDQDTTLKALLLPPVDSQPSYTRGVPILLSVNWLVDPASKMLVGWHPTWWAQHKALAPERIISGLINKLNGDGLEIDDVASTLLLSKDQYTQWISRHKDLHGLRVPKNYMAFWKMYAGLSSENKALAKSEGGLPMADLDRDEVVAAFGARVEKVSGMSELDQLAAMSDWIEDRPEMKLKMAAWVTQHIRQTANSGEDETDFVELMYSLMEDFPEVKAALGLPPTDQGKVLSLKMRLVRTDSPNLERFDLSTTFPAGVGEKKPHAYSLRFEGDGIKVEAGNLNALYPKYSQKRIAELTEAQKKSEKKEAGN